MTLFVVPPVATLIDTGRSSQRGLPRASLDRFGFLDALYREAKPWLDEREALKKAIQAEHENTPGDQPIRCAGSLYYVDLTMRENQRSVTDKPKAFAALRKALGLEKLAEALSYTLKVLDEHVPSQKQAPFVSSARTGPRTVTAALIAPPAPPKAA